MTEQQLNIIDIDALPLIPLDDVLGMPMYLSEDEWQQSPLSKEEQETVPSIVSFPEQQQQRPVDIKEVEEQLLLAIENPQEGMRALLAAEAEESLQEFIKQAWQVVEPKTPLRWGWHIEAICDHLQAVDNWEIQKLIINIPPRHMKSLTVAVFWPAWRWIKNPELRWLFSSYAEPLSTRDSVKCRRLIQSPWYQGNWADRFTLVGDQNQKTRFENDKTGVRLSTSVGGVGTGEGGDILCFPGDVRVKAEIEGREVHVPIAQLVKEDNRDIKIFTSATQPKPLLRTYTRPAPEYLYEVEFDDGTILHCTEEHPIWVENKQQFVKARDLAPGDICIKLEGGVEDRKKKLVTVQAVRRIRTPAAVRNVYNLEVAEDHCYFANGILVHNCVDDPHNVKEVESDAKRAEVLVWWDETMSTRINDPERFAKIIIMQRSHDNDLTGHILAKEAGYVHLCLPARYEPDDLRTKTPLSFTDPRTEEGEPLWPEKYNDKALQELENELGSYAAAAQLQQRPHPRGGGMFQVDNFVLVQAAGSPAVASVRYWDKAATEGGKGARTAGVRMDELQDGSFLVSDVVKGRWTWGKREQIIKLTAEKDGPEAEVYVEQEPGSGGKESAENTIRNLAGFKAFADRVTGSKESRAQPYAAQVEVGNVKVLMGKPWTRDFLEEHRHFPTGATKDQVDAAAGAFSKLVSRARAGTW